MNNDEKLFNEKIRGIYAAIEANANINYKEFKNISIKLDRIEEQTTKTNDRVTKLELNEKERYNKCPNTTEVKEIQNNLLEYKMFKKYPKLFFILGSLIGLLFIAQFIFSII